MADRVAVIGAGYAGLSAAVELAKAGIGVDMFEASRTLGGRARAASIDGRPLDNGAHILVGAYTETLRLMRTVGAPEDGLLRRPLHLLYPGRFALRAPPLPAPWHLAAALATARGLTISERCSAIRFIRALKADRFRLPADIDVATLLATEPAATRRFLWEPLCLAALNTPPAEASAQVFANVLRDSLAAGRAASDLLLPRTDLSTLFPDHAARWLEGRGARLFRNARAAPLTGQGTALVVNGQVYRRVVAAVAPFHLPELLAGFPRLATIIDDVRALAWQPITTCYLAYRRRATLPYVMLGDADGPAQWLLDLDTLRGLPGMIAGVISASGHHDDLPPASLAGQVHRQVAGVLPGLPAPTWHRVTREKRATFSCAPGLRRPQTATPVAGLWLAGDYVAGDYPATIEGAVRSGVRAARLLIAQAAAT